MSSYAIITCFKRTSPKVMSVLSRVDKWPPIDNFGK